MCSLKMFRTVIPEAAGYGHFKGGSKISFGISAPVSSVPGK